MRCPRCQTEKLVKIGHLTYCRNCISFGQVRPEFVKPNWDYKFESTNVYYDLSYDLSKKQKEVSQQIILAIENKQHVLISAVCGSGKTEIVYPCICHFLNKQQRIGFACPRKDLAIELYDRFKSQLKNIEIALVYGGHTDDLYKPLVVLTTHQLYRFWNYFDVLIIDEVDAFPFYADEHLYQMALASNKGIFVLLSATSFEKAPPKGFVKFTIDRRYHNEDLPVPRLIWLPNLLSILYICKLLASFKKENKPVMIFVPEISDFHLFNFLFRMLKLRYKIINSKTPLNTSTLQAFKEKKFDILLTTTLLERGVTFENVQVIVYKAHHPIFTSSTLIQIAGRVGRKANFPTGDVIFIGKHISKGMKLCKNHIIRKNASYVANKPLDCSKVKKI